MANYLVIQNNGGRFEGEELVGPEAIALMHTPPRGTESSYTMGWTAPDGAKPRVVEHDGVLSAFHADAALLPDERYGVVLLYNQSYALADYEGTKQGLLDLLEGKRPDTGGPDAGTIGIILAALALLTTALQVRGPLVRFSCATRRGTRTARWGRTIGAPHAPRDWIQEEPGHERPKRSMASSSGPGMDLFPGSNSCLCDFTITSLARC